MARLLAFISNRPDVGARAIDSEKRHLSVRVKEGITPGWGVGFYQAGEILLKRRPIDDRREIDLATITHDLRADILVTHVRSATIGAPRTENTHPFRFRQWLFAQTGTADGLVAQRGRVFETLPAFLGRNVKGDTDSELIFHLFLSFLHDMGHIDRPQVEPEIAHSALASCISLVDRFCAEQGAPASTLNMVVTCPDYVVFVQGGGSAAFRNFTGKGEIDRLLSDGGPQRSRTHEDAKSRLTVVASDFDDDQLPPGWTPIAERAIVTLTRTHDPKVENF